MEVDKMLVGKRINGIRKEKGLTMEEFGSLVGGASKGLVNNWEKGVNLPNNNRIKLIATLGRITVEELLYGDLKAYCYDIFNTIKDEKYDNGSPTLHANILLMMEHKGNSEKISNSFEQGYETIRDLNLSYEDTERIREILRNSIVLHFSDHEYTNAGAINFSIDYIRELYDSEILDHFLYEIDNKNKKPQSGDLILERENINQDLYDEIKQIANEAIDQLNKLKEKYSEDNK